MTEKDLEQLVEIKVLQTKIDALEREVSELNRELHKKKTELISEAQIAKLLSDYKVPWQLREIYVVTYYYKGCYAWGHAIFYGVPRESQYKDALSRISREETWKGLKVPTTEFNKIVLDQTAVESKENNRVWNEGIRKMDDPPLASIDRHVLYIVTDGYDKSEFEIVLGVFTDPKELARQLSIYYHSYRSWGVDLYLVEGSESCILTPNKDRKSCTFFINSYPEEALATVILAKTNEILARPNLG